MAVDFLRNPRFVDDTDSQNCRYRETCKIKWTSGCLFLQDQSLHFLPSHLWMKREMGFWWQSDLENFFKKLITPT